MPVERSWSETFLALPVFVGEWAQRLAPPASGSRAPLYALGLASLLGLAWWGAAAMAGYKRPSLGLSVLLLAQGFGLAYWAGSMRAPIRKVAPASTCRAFDFGARTVRSDGILSPQQVIDWRRARGFSGLAFADIGRSMPQSELQSLRRANPDMILLGGAEWHASSGWTRTLLAAPTLAAPTSRVASGAGSSAVIRPQAWREPNSLAPRSSAEATTAEATTDSIEAWAANVGDENLARRARGQNLAVVGSASLGAGSDCFVWGLIPNDARTPQDVIRALKGRRVAVAHALLADETPANMEARRQPSAGLGSVAKAWREAMSKLSPSQKFNARLQVLALVLLLIWWGARRSESTEAPSGPQSAMKFVQRKRLLRRANGLAMMLLAFAGTLWEAQFTFSDLWPAKNALPAAWIVPATLLAWLALDALYLYGRSVWKRVH